MRRVPCIFCELRRRRIYGVSFYFRNMALHFCSLSIRVECVGGAYTPASCRYAHKYGEKRRGDVYVSRHFLLMHSPRYACIFISRHKRIYWLCSLICISTFMPATNPRKKRLYNDYLSLEIIRNKEDEYH